MIINSIKLCNFRQYKGEQLIKFCTDKEKNVTVFLGDNTSGKSTLIQAFHWCLYENDNFKTKELINSEVFASASVYEKNCVYVELDIIHGEVNYTIKRNQAVTKQPDFKMKVDKSTLVLQYQKSSGETGTIREVEHKEKINSILPENLAGYFFYDGENDINSKKDVVSSIRGLMGLEAISKGVDLLSLDKSSSVIGKLKKSMDTGSENKGSDFVRRIEKIEKELPDLDTQRKQAEIEKEALTNRKEEFSNKLLANAGVKEKQLRKISLERDVEYSQKQEATLECNFVNNFSKNAYKFFCKGLVDKALDVINNADTNSVGIPEMHSKAIDFILERKKCICGCDLSSNQGAIDKINYEKSLLPPQHIGTIVREYKNKINALGNDIDGYEEEIKKCYFQIRDNKNRIDDKTKELAQVSLEIEGCVDVAKIEIDVRQNQESLTRASNTLRTLENSILEKNTLIKDYEKELNKLSVVSSKNDDIRLAIAYAENTYNWFYAEYIKNEKETKEQINNSIQELFNQMYHGERRVEIDKDYRITLFTDNGNGNYITDTSPGLETVKNFAFVCGLVDIARKRSQQTDVIAKTEPYPIIMDAPFSKADHKHVAKISKVLPNVAEQAILFVMDKDWEHASTGMGDKVGLIYRIEKQSETHSVIKEDN